MKFKKMNLRKNERRKIKSKIIDNLFKNVCILQVGQDTKKLLLANAINNYYFKID